MHPLKYQSEFYIMWLVHTFLGPETVAERALKSPLLLYLKPRVEVTRKLCFELVNSIAIQRHKNESNPNMGLLLAC